MKIDLADHFFSQWIRLRDMRCMRCGSPVRLNGAGRPASHTNSHYYGRAAENTRFEPLNCDTLCYPCHTYWASTHRDQYDAFKLEQLGQVRFDLLLLASNTYLKKDRLLQKIYWRNKLKTDYGLPR